MFKCFLDNKETSHPDFKDAFKRMFEYVKAKSDKGNMSYYELEQWIWIDTPSNEHLDFYDARDAAIEAKLIEGNKWIAV